MKNERLIKVIAVMNPDIKSPLAIPSASSFVQAGFPSPAEDYIEKKLDLNELVIKHPAATFFVKVEGDSMRDANIFSGDILVVDRSLEPTNGKIVVAVVNGEFTVKRLFVDSTGVYLDPENPAYPRLKVSDESDFRVWGVVAYVIHKAD